MGLMNKTYDQGSATTMVAAFDPQLTGTFTSAGFQIEIILSITTYPDCVFEADTVLYLDDCQPTAPKDYASDARLAEKLWHLSDDLVVQKLFL